MKFGFPCFQPPGFRYCMTYCLVSATSYITLYNVMYVRVLALYQVHLPVCSMKDFAFFAAVISFLVYSPWKRSVHEE